MDSKPIIYVVDDDPGVSRALNSVGQLLDLQVKSYSTAIDFLAEYNSDCSGCLILDIKMPGMTGIELQQRLFEDKFSLPIIMISGHADVRITVDVMRRGAVTLLEKPFRLDELTTHIRQALKQDAERRISLSEQAETKSRLAKLTFKEREVFELVSDGKTNKEIAAFLHLSIRAVEDRRSRLMKKLGVRSAVELVQLRPIMQADS